MEFWFEGDIIFWCDVIGLDDCEDYVEIMFDIWDDSFGLLKLEKNKLMVVFWLVVLGKLKMMVKLLLLFLCRFDWCKLGVMFVFRGLRFII